MVGRWLAVALSLSVAAASRVDAALLVPQYSSLPGAPATLYLDFGGIDNFGTWNSRTVGSVPAYDVDGKPAAFSATNARSRSTGR